MRSRSLPGYRGVSSLQHRCRSPGPLRQCRHESHCQISAGIRRIRSLQDTKYPNPRNHQIRAGAEELRSLNSQAQNREVCFAILFRGGPHGPSDRKAKSSGASQLCLKVLKDCRSGEAKDCRSGEASVLWEGFCSKAGGSQHKCCVRILVSLLSPAAVRVFCPSFGLVVEIFDLRSQPSWCVQAFRS